MFNGLITRILARLEDALGHVSRGAVAIALALLMLMGGWLVVTVQTINVHTIEVRAPLIYSAASYTARPAAFCPGGPLLYTQTYLMRDAGVRVGAYSSIVEANGNPVNADNVPFDNVFIYPQDVGKVISVPKVITGVVAQLPPGNYEWRIFSQTPGRLPSSYYVPFTILDCSGP